MKSLESLHLKLGRSSTDHRLDAIPRQLVRDRPVRQMSGWDVWNAYEVGFVDPSGKPIIGSLRLRYPFDSTAMVESKSLKLFLNHLADEPFANKSHYLDTVGAALTQCVGSEVETEWLSSLKSIKRRHLAGSCLDALKLEHVSQPAGSLLRTIDGPGEYTYFTHAFRSMCPVTSQPDWASVWIRWQAAQTLSPSSLFTYLMSFRSTAEFHESCCERILNDLSDALNPQGLVVACYFLRRGGIDINPMRSIGCLGLPVFTPTWRQ